MAQRRDGIVAAAGPASRYLGVLLGVVAAFLLGGWVLGRSSLYISHSKGDFEAIEANAFSTTDVNADVVFVGDSALQMGVRPRQFMEETGLSAYSLALPGGAMLRAPELVLDRYLSGNTRPRLIVLYIAPWTRLETRYEKGAGWVDGVAMLLRHGSPALLGDYVWHQPSTLLQYPYFVWSRILWQTTWSTAEHDALVKELSFEKGYFRYKGRRPAVSGPGCDGDRGEVIVDTAAIAAFRERYRDKADAFAVYLAPLPDCAPALARARAAFKDIVDNPIASFPVQYYLADRSQSHLVETGAKANTARVAHWAIAYLAHRPSASVTP